VSKDIIIENTGFNSDYWVSRSEDEFVTECLKSKVFKQYPESDRIILLREAYKLIRQYYEPDAT
jgi:hypothetical protein